MPKKGSAKKEKSSGKGSSKSSSAPPPPVEEIPEPDVDYRQISPPDVSNVLTCVYTGHLGACSALAVYENTFISANLEGIISQYDIKGEGIRNFSGHEKSVNDLCISGDGSRLWSASSDGSCLAWDLRSAECALDIWSHTLPVNSVDISSDSSLLLSSSDDGEIHLHNIRKAEQNIGNEERNNVLPSSSSRSSNIPSSAGVVSVYEHHECPVICSRFFTRGMAVSASTDRTATCFDLETGKVLNVYQGEQVALTSLATGDPSSGLLFCGSTSGVVRVWDVRMPYSVRILRGHTDAVRALLCSPSGLLYSGSDEGIIREWRVEHSSNCTFKFEGHEDSVSALAWKSSLAHPSSKIASSSNDPTHGLGSEASSMLLSASFDHTVRSWNLNDVEEYVQYIEKRTLCEKYYQRKEEEEKLKASKASKKSASSKRGSGKKKKK